MGAYRTVRVLAEGGMGQVELVVRQEGEFRRAYALKRLRRGFRDDPEVREMFTEEARIAGLLHHPNVVSVVDVGEDEDGPYLVMDYVQGVSLSQLVRALVQREEEMPEQVALRVFIEVARGLHAAHELVNHEGQRLDLVHRDVSPQNILVGFDGVARLTDFGIAKARVRGDRTSTGVLKGKIGYFAPEQLRFRPVTPRTDLFALGVVLFESLTGRRLYASKSAEQTARRILDEPPPDLYDLRQDLHPGLTELLFRLLAKNPDRRPADAAEVADALEGILVDILSTDPPASVRAFLKERFPDREEHERQLIENATTHVAQPGARWPWIAAAAVAVALVGGGATYAALRRPDAPPTPSFPTASAPRVEELAPAPAAETTPAEEATPEPTEASEPVAEAPVEGGSEAEPEPPSPRRRRRRRRPPTENAAPPEPAAATAPSPREPEPEGDELMGWGR